MKKTGILLLNLGTPDAPTVRAVRRYLREFLSDPKVVDISSIARWMLLNFIILPFRPRITAKMYQTIWTEQGSPLLVFSQAFQKKVASRLGKDFVVELGMRYGDPSIASALEKLHQVELDRLLIFPLFPQYSSAASESAIEKALEVIKAENYLTPHLVIRDFYDHKAFIESEAKIITAHTKDFPVDHYLFSYHGVPVRQLEPFCDTKFCDRAQTCPVPRKYNKQCYRAQCYATSRAIAEKLGIDATQYSVAFQSRLGRIPWIQPYTDQFLEKLIAREVKNLVIISPSFVADCLETLEEIGVRTVEQWQELGGGQLRLIPALNDHPHWVEGFVDMVKTAESI